jgi:hypothetical protein
MVESSINNDGRIRLNVIVDEHVDLRKYDSKFKAMNPRIHTMSVEFGGGSDIYKSIDLTKELSLFQNLPDDGYIFFQFNELEVRVNHRTDTELLKRDWQNSKWLDTDVIGPNCEAELPYEVITQIGAAKQEYALIAEQRREEYKSKCELKIQRFVELTEGVELQLHPNVDWLHYRNQHSTDSEVDYHKAAYDYAERWAKIMTKLSREANTWIGDNDIYKTAADMADVDGITGFQFGMARQLLEKLWLYGDVLARLPSLGLYDGHDED